MCAENIVRIDLVKESRNVTRHDRAAVLPSQAVGLAFKSTTSRLEAENAALRHQLIALRRKVRGRVEFTNNDRLFFILLYR